FFLLERQCLLVNLEEKVSWADARTWCHNKGGDLAIPQDSRTLISLLNSFNVGEHLWLGGSDLATEGVWHDVSSKPINLRSSLWSESEPNDYGGNEDCVHLRYKEGEYGWNDVNCEYTYNFICEHQPI
ncbi:C-type lectin domain family 4 member F-like 4, partial [Homarus americanus]